MAWRGYVAQPDDSRSAREVPSSDVDATCSFCGRHRDEVDGMIAQPVLRRWSDTGEVDHGEQKICHACTAGAERIEREGRRCDLCGSGVDSPSFVGIAMAGTVCEQCIGLMHSPRAEWRSLDDACVYCRRPLAGTVGWTATPRGPAICRGCAP